jgi:hypothetical protein
MRDQFNRLFVDHPREVEETYLEHMAASGRFGFKLLRLSACAFCHALVPGVFKTAVSDEIKATARTMGKRADEARECRMREAGVWDPGL